MVYYTYGLRARSITAGRQAAAGMAVPLPLQWRGKRPVGAQLTVSFIPECEPMGWYCPHQSAFLADMARGVPVGDFKSRQADKERLTITGRCAGLLCIILF